MAMTPNAINQAIAEYCGWQKTVLLNSRYECGSHACKSDTHVRWAPPDGGYSPVYHEGGYFPGPNYNGDLNAMHSAEAVLKDASEDQWGDYCDMLYDAGGYHASAEVKAKCFCEATRIWTGAGHLMASVPVGENVQAEINIASRKVSDKPYRLFHEPKPE